MFLNLYRDRTLITDNNVTIGGMLNTRNNTQIMTVTDMGDEKANDEWRQNVDMIELYQLDKHLE